MVNRQLSCATFFQLATMNNVRGENLTVAATETLSATVLPAAILAKAAIAPMVRSIVVFTMSLFASLSACGSTCRARGLSCYSLRDAFRYHRRLRYCQRQQQQQIRYCHRHRHQQGRHRHGDIIILFLSSFFTHKKDGQRPVAAATDSIF